MSMCRSHQCMRNVASESIRHRSVHTITHKQSYNHTRTHVQHKLHQTSRALVQPIRFRSNLSICQQLKRSFSTRANGSDDRNTPNNTSVPHNNNNNDNNSTDAVNNNIPDNDEQTDDVEPVYDTTAEDKHSRQTISAEIMEMTVQRRSVLERSDVAARYHAAMSRLNNISGYGIDNELKQFLARQSAAGWLTLDSMTHRRPRVHQQTDPLRADELAELLAQTDKYKSKVRSFAFYRRLGFDPLSVDIDEEYDEEDVDELNDAADEWYDDAATPTDTDNVAYIDAYHGYILPNNEDMNDKGPIGARQFSMHSRYEPYDTRAGTHQGRYDIRDRGIGRQGSWAKQITQFTDRPTRSQNKHIQYVLRSTSTLYQTQPILHQQLMSILPLINSQIRIYLSLLNDIHTLVQGRTNADNSDQFRPLVGKVRALQRYLQNEYNSEKRDQRLQSRDALIAAIFLRRPLGQSLCTEAVKYAGMSIEEYNSLIEKYRILYGIDMDMETYVSTRTTHIRTMIRSLADPYLTHQKLVTILDSLRQVTTDSKNQDNCVFQRLYQIYTNPANTPHQDEIRKLIMQAYRENDQFELNQRTLMASRHQQQTTTKSLDSAAQHSQQSDNIDGDVSTTQSSISAAARAFDDALAAEAAEITADVTDQAAEPFEFDVSAHRSIVSDVQQEYTRENESSTSLLNDITPFYDAEFKDPAFAARMAEKRQRIATNADLNPAHEEESHAFDYAYFHTDQADWKALNRLSPGEYEMDRGPRMFTEDEDPEQLTDNVQELMYALHMHDPTQYHERTLARMFGVSIRTAKGTLLSQATVRHYRSMGFPTTEEEIQSQILPTPSEEIDDTPEYDDWEDYPEQWEYFGAGNGSAEDLTAIENKSDRAVVETSIKFDNPEHMYAGPANPPIPIDDKHLVDEYVNTQMKLRRFWTHGEHLDEKEAELRKEIGYIGAPPKIVLPNKLDTQVLPPTQYNLLLLNITDTPNGRYQMAVRDRNGVLREVNAEEFKSIRYAERPAKAKFKYVKFRNFKPKRQQAM